MTDEPIQALDAEMSRLEKARTVIELSLTEATSQSKGRTMSVAGRAAIAEAQRKRWAKQKATAQTVQGAGSAASGSAKVPPSQIEAKVMVPARPSSER
jgi:hypothetical protein